MGNLKCSLRVTLKSTFLNLSEDNESVNNKKKLSANSSR